MICLHKMHHGFLRTIHKGRYRIIGFVGLCD